MVDEAFFSLLYPAGASPRSTVKMIVSQQFKTVQRAGARKRYRRYDLMLGNISAVL